MNTTCLLGVLCFFGLQSVIYKSLPGILVTLNGILYYMNPYSKKFRMNDIFWNMILAIPIIILNKTSRKYMSIGLILWLINNFKLNGNNLVHVFCVQLPISIALYEYLKNQ